MYQLNDFLDAWFGPGDRAANLAERISPFMRINHQARPNWFDDDVEVLVVEQQGVWLWGRDADGRYVERENEPGTSWRDIGESAEAFWLHVAAFEAVSNLPASRSAQEMSAQTVATIEQATNPLPIKSWAWPGTGHTIRYRGSAVVMICVDDDDFWVVASAPDESSLAWLDELDLVWDEVDTRRDKNEPG